MTKILKHVGVAVKGFSALTGGLSAGKALVRPLYAVTDTMSFDKMEEKVHTKVINDARKEG